jgi:hypothetical protein
MRSVKVVGLCLVVGLALGSIGVATASAAFPEFGTCKKLSMLTGKWIDNKCSMENAELKGLYEFEPLTTETKFESSIGETFLELEKGTVKCKEGKNEGKTSSGQNSTHVNIVIKLLKCTAKAGAEQCSTPGAKEGEIVFKQLKGWLIYVEKKPRATKKAGLFVEPETGLFTEWECGLGLFAVKVLKNTSMISNRCLAGEITPINEAVEKFALTFAVGIKGQEIKEFEYLGFPVKCQLEAEAEAGKIENLNVSLVDTISWLPKGTKIEVKS